MAGEESVEEPAFAAVAMLASGVGLLLDDTRTPLTPIPAVELPALLEQVEVVRRRLDALDARLVAELVQRGVAGAFAATSAAQLLIQRLRIDPGEARARVERAGDLGPRRGLTGEPLDPIYPRARHALAAGSISTRHVQVVTECVERLPDALSKEHAEAVEEVLVDAASSVTPRHLAQLAREIIARVDPDGTLPDDAARQRRRAFGLRKHLDGSATPTGYLTPELVALLEPVLDALSAPRHSPDPSATTGTCGRGGVDVSGDGRDGEPVSGAGGADDQSLSKDGPPLEPDARTAAQRRHDALAEIVTRLLRSGTLPAAGGVPVSLLVTTTDEDLAAHAAHPGAGTGTTDSGQVLPLHVVLRLGEVSLTGIRLDTTGAVLSAGREQRLASPTQRRILAARDRGCCFPACDRPAAWCQVHHVVEWADGGRTDVAKMCLLCRYHHAHFEAAGWRVAMTNGIPEWIPPPWLDAHQRQHPPHPHRPSRRTARRHRLAGVRRLPRACHWPRSAHGTRAMC